MERTSHVYIMSSKSGVLYVGVTSNLSHRVAQHKEKQIPGFTPKYNIINLVWFEPHAEIRSAIAREKGIKSWRRSKKTTLIESLNPNWDDLSLHL
jgi:putative endonuclease